MLGISRGENHRWRHFHFGELASDLQAVHAAHADIHQHQIRLFVINDVECGFAIAGFANDFISWKLS